MIQLTEKINLTHFYFSTMDDCNIFINTFKDHLCTVPWNDPVEIPDDYVPISNYRYIIKNPKVRAEDNLSWGFSLIRRYNEVNNNNNKSLIQYPSLSSYKKYYESIPHL